MRSIAPGSGRGPSRSVDTPTEAPTTGDVSAKVRSAEGQTSGRFRYRAAFTLLAALLAALLGLLALTISGVVTEMAAPPSGQVFPIAEARPDAAAATATNLHVAVVAIDEVQQLATLRISGHHICRTTCPWQDRILVFSLAADESLTEGLPPSVAVELPTTNVQVAQTLQLPVHGQPIRYPFDTYLIHLGIVLERVLADGTVQKATPTEASGRLSLTIQERLPRQTMSAPALVDPASERVGDDPYEYLYVAALTFSQPTFLRALTVLPIALVSTAAAYAAFERALHQLVVDSGALVLGIGGIRSVLIPNTISYATGVDLALSLVILLLLSAGRAGAAGRPRPRPPAPTSTRLRPNRPAVPGADERHRRPGWRAACV